MSSTDAATEPRVLGRGQRVGSGARLTPDDTAAPFGGPSVSPERAWMKEARRLLEAYSSDHTVAECGNWHSPDVRKLQRPCWAHRLLRDYPE